MIFFCTTNLAPCLGCQSLLRLAENHYEVQSSESYYLPHCGKGSILLTLKYVKWISLGWCHYRQPKLSL